MVGDPCQLYVVPSIAKAESSNSIIIGMISVCRWLAFHLFNLVSNYSYVSTYYEQYLEFSWDALSVSLCISTLVGDCFVVE